jgi:WD40 repeat protein
MKLLAFLTTTPLIASVLILLSSVAYAHEDAANLDRCGPNVIAGFKPIYKDISGTHKGENFGVSVSLNEDGTILAIGAERYGQPVQTGRVQVYKRDREQEWMQLGQDLLGNGGEWFGTSVKLSDDGDMLVVGSWAGKVRVFRWSNTTGTSRWQQVGSTIFDNGSLGQAVDISGDGKTIVAGDRSHGHRFTGQARVFRLSCHGDEEWIQIGDSLNGRTGRDKISTDLQWRCLTMVTWLPVDLHSTSGTASTLGMPEYFG